MGEPARPKHGRPWVDPVGHLNHGLRLNQQSNQEPQKQPDKKVTWEVVESKPGRGVRSLLCLTQGGRVVSRGGWTGTGSGDSGRNKHLVAN